MNRAQRVSAACASFSFSTMGMCCGHFGFAFPAVQAPVGAVALADTKVL